MDFECRCLTRCPNPSNGTTYVGSIWCEAYCKHYKKHYPAENAVECDYVKGNG